MIKIIKCVILLQCLLTGCRYQEVKYAYPQENEVKKGEKFRITLPENHVEKESWSLQPGYDARVVRRLNEVWHGNEKGIDFNFEALSAGTTTLSFTQRKYADTLQTVDYKLKITEN